MTRLTEPPKLSHQRRPSQTTRQTTTLSGHTGEVFAVALSPDGTTLVTGSADGTARIWGGTAGGPMLPLATCARHCPSPCTDAVAVLGGVWLNPIDRRVLTFASDGSILAWKAPASP